MGMQKLVHFSVSVMLLEVCVCFFFGLYIYMCQENVTLKSLMCYVSGVVEWSGQCFGLWN